MAAAGIGIALAVLSVPRIFAALYAWPAGDVIIGLDKINSPPPDVPDLAAARQNLQLAQIWQKDATLAVELARIDLVLATRQLRSGLDAKPLLDETIETVRDALHRFPAQARGWLILSEATLARDGATAPKLAEYLAESLRASPHDIWLASDRVWLSILLWDRLDQATRASAAMQMRSVIQFHGIDRLARLAKLIGDPEPVRQALSDDQALRQRFEAIYLQL